MKVIYKQQLQDANRQEIMIPEGAEIISAHQQTGMMCLWFMCNTKNKLTSRIIRIYVTGQDIDDVNLKFINTIIDGYGYVLHIFEEIKTL